MRRSRKQVQKLQSRRAEREMEPPPLPQWNRLGGFAALLTLVCVVAYALELDVALRWGSDEVTGRISWLDDRTGKPAFGYGYGRGSWPILIVANEAGEPIHYFHSFVPGVYGKLYDVIRARANANAGGHPLTTDRLVMTQRSRITRRSSPPRRPYCRLLYAGVGRKSVYAFEELSSQP